VLLGIIFDVHAFVGLIAGVVTGAPMFASLMRAYSSTKLVGLRREIIKGGCLGIGFLIIAWPWLMLHLSLRSTLAKVNSHGVHGGVPLGAILLLTVAIVLLGIFVWLGNRTIRQKVFPFAVLSLFLLLLCVPALNGSLAKHTSSFMSARVPYLLPCGLVAAIGIYGASIMEERLKWVRVVWCAALLCALAPLAVLGIKMALSQVYLTRTHDYDQHPWQYLDELAALNLRGKVVLSDPFTSYYVRAVLGCYAVTVPSGHASPAIDYKKCDAAAKLALQKGPTMMADHAIGLLIVDREHTPSFSGVSEDVILRTWQEQGWRVMTRTKRVITLMPPL